MRLKNLSLPYGARIYKALSDESRIRIINLLHHHRELCISDLEQVLDFTQTKTSRHLSFLRNAGIVNARKSEQWVFYSIKEEVYDILAQTLGYLNKDQTLGRDIETFDIMYSNRELAAFRHARAPVAAER